MRVRLRADFRKRIKDESLHQAISPLGVYSVLEVDSEYYRVIDDVGDPILYPKELFEVLDAVVPHGWQFREYEDNDYYLEPIRVGKPGFYEKYFCSDGDLQAQAEARQVLREVMETALLTCSEQDRPILERELARMVRSWSRPGRVRP